MVDNTLSDYSCGGSSGFQMAFYEFICHRIPFYPSSRNKRENRMVVKVTLKMLVRQ